MKTYTKEEMMELAENHYHGGYDDWGYGQMRIERIIAPYGYNTEEYFFAKKVTAIDCESDYHHHTDGGYSSGPVERTITCDEGNLFVFNKQHCYDMMGWIVK